MEKAKVYFSDLRTSPTSNLLDKMERLLKRAGIGQLPLKDSFTAIKIHFGEPGNLAYIRPNYAARLANLLRSYGAKPFLTDSNTLYSGRRSNAVDHLESAMENGFNPISAQCQVIIADGLKGTTLSDSGNLRFQHRRNGNPHRRSAEYPHRLGIAAVLYGFRL